MIINQNKILHENRQFKKCGVRKSNSAHRPPFLTTNFPSRFFFELKMGSKDSASPHASFILTRNYFFIVSFMSICIFLSRHSFIGLVFKIFKIVKRVFLLCFYVRGNRVFPTGVSPPTSLKFAHSRTRTNSPLGRLPPYQIFIPPTKYPSPPLNNNSQVITQ